MRQSTLKSRLKPISAAVMLVSLLALTACNRGYGCPNALKADAPQPTRVK